VAVTGRAAQRHGALPASCSLSSLRRLAGRSLRQASPAPYPEGGVCPLLALLPSSIGSSARPPEWGVGDDAAQHGDAASRAQSHTITFPEQLVCANAPCSLLSTPRTCTTTTLASEAPFPIPGNSRGPSCSPLRGRTAARQPLTAARHILDSLGLYRCHDFSKLPPCGLRADAALCLMGSACDKALYPKP